MPKYTVELSDVEEKALLTDMADVGEWINNWAHASALRLMNQIVETTTDKRASALSYSDRVEIVRAANVESAIAREARRIAEEAAKLSREP